MNKPFSHLGDSWPEFFGNLLLLILLVPLLAFLYTFMLLDTLIGVLARRPKPKQVPVVINDDAMPAKQKQKIYIDRFRKEVSKLDVTVNASDDSIMLQTKFAIVYLWSYDDSFFGIQLQGDDKILDTGFWHTDEEKNLDIFFWYAVAALQAGVSYDKNWRGRKIGWVHSGPMEIWMGVSTDEDRYFSSFIRFARHKFGRRMQ